MKNDNQEQTDPVTLAIREILRGAHPDWVVAPRKHIKELANKNNVNPDTLILKLLPEGDK